MQRKVIVLCYHRINTLDLDKNLLAVSEENFREHLRWLNGNYDILRAEEDWESEGRDAVVITFDDGYEDFYIKALPIIEEMKIPATVFITNGKDVSNRMMWWDELEYLIYDRYTPPYLHLKDGIFDYEWSLDCNENKDECYKQIHFLMKNLISSERREEWLIQMWRWKREKRTLIDRYKMLSDEEIIELSKNPYITLGAHTLNHSALKNRSIDEQQIEIKDSIRKLENTIRRKTTVFSYPFGVYGKDYDEIANGYCEENGIEKTFATNFGAWNPKDGLLNIKRNGINNKNLEEFKAYLKWIEEA